MITDEREPGEEMAEEVRKLIDTLLTAERRLDLLTEGGLDAVSDSNGGGPFLLRRAQEQLRRRDASKQSGILNALPAHVALLNTEGVILSVNEAWRQFGDANALHWPGHALGANYLEICDRADGDGAAEARQAGAGIRDVLAGVKTTFSFEYACHSPTEQRWFLMRVAPLANDSPGGAVVMHINITERKVAEEYLRGSEANMATAQRLARIGSWELDLSCQGDPYAGGVRWSNEMFRIAGFEPGTVAVSSAFFFSLVHPEDCQPIRAAVEKAIREHTPYSIVHRLIRPSGQTRVLHEMGEVTLDEKTGRAVKLVGTAHDVTERTNAEKALRASFEEFRTLSEAMPQIVWVTRADGMTVYFNQHWTDYTGLTLEESIGDGWIKPFHPDDRERAQRAWAEATATLAIYSVETRLRRVDGTYRWWLVRGVPVREATGNALKWVGTCTDIDDLKQAQDRVGQQAALLDIAHDAIMVKDLQDVIIFWNKGAERIYGWSALEALGRVSQELLGPDPGAFAAASKTLIATGEWQGEMLFKGKDGNKIDVDVRWTLVRDKQGEAKSVLAINTDITSKKKLEEQFLRVQRMESIGTLASGIAHDLNNVLAPIMMSVEMLKDMVPGVEGQNLLIMLQSCAQRGANLIKQVLSFARGMGGKRVPVNVIHILSDIENIVRDTFPKNIVFQLTRPRELGTVLGDPTQLHQVFMNLCVNARDAMPLGGRLKVVLENIVVDEIYADMNSDSRLGPYLLVKVEDTGSGIPPAIKNKIFEPFYTTKEIGKGTGLGLSTTQAIVKSHGGFISLYSEMGKGAQFKVYLPAAPSTRSETEHLRARPAPPSGQGELLLIVDDEEPIRSVTQKTLERFNYRVLLAANGAEAIAIYAKQGSEIALVLTDMAMPIMDGPATIVALRALNPEVKIIGCSGHASTGGVAQALTAGVLHFIPKPYTAETLLKVLQVALRPIEGRQLD